MKDISRSYFELLEKGMRIANRVHKLHLDNCEFAILLQFLILKESMSIWLKHKKFILSQENVPSKQRCGQQIE